MTKANSLIKAMLALADVNVPQPIYLHKQLLFTVTEYFCKKQELYLTKTGYLKITQRKDASSRKIAKKSKKETIAGCNIS